MTLSAAQGGQSHFRGDSAGWQCNIHRAAKIGAVPCERLQIVDPLDEPGERAHNLQGDRMAAGNADALVSERMDCCHNLPGGVMYQVKNMPDVAAVNRLMEKVRTHQA